MRYKATSILSWKFVKECSCFSLEKPTPTSRSVSFLFWEQSFKRWEIPMILRSLECRFLTIALCDAAEPWQLGSQDAATPMMQGIIDLHHDIFFFLILILVFVSRMLVRALWHFNEQTNPIPQRIVHGTTIEIIRTIFPSVIPLFIAIPSFALLYSMDGVLVDPAITIKAIGHQWYRSAPLHEGDLSATKCLKVEYGSRSIWLTGNLPFPPSRDFNNYSMPETGSLGG
jgi:heme/copper-type cytochrome/quinol oxidase subunit 2